MHHPALGVLLLQMEVEIDKIEQAEQTEAVPRPEVGMQEGAAAEDGAEAGQMQEGPGKFRGCLVGSKGDSTTFGCVWNWLAWLHKQRGCS